MFINLKSFLFLLLNSFISCTHSVVPQDEIPLLKEAPVWLNPCRRSGNELDECVRDTFQNMFPFLAKGIPEIGMDAFEPMHIDYVGIKKGSGPVTLAGSFKNLVIRGPSNTTAIYTKFDLKNNKLDIGLFIPNIKVDAMYDLKGKLLLLPLVGVGHAKLHLKNVSTNVATDIYFPKISGEEVMVASSMKVDFSLTHMRVYLDNLFNGNKVLGRSVNQFLNQNALLVVEELKETIGENLAVVFKKVMNDAFSHIPTKLWLMTDSEIKDNNKTYWKNDKNDGKNNKNNNKNDKNQNKKSSTNLINDKKLSSTIPNEKLISTTESVVKGINNSTLNNIKTQSSTSKTTINSSTVKLTTEKTTTVSTSSSTLSSSSSNFPMSSSTVPTTTIPSEIDVNNYNESSDEILEETDESRVDREESHQLRSENNNQLDQIQAESSNRLNIRRV